jgi:hypothetical protein
LTFCSSIETRHFSGQFEIVFHKYRTIVAHSINWKQLLNYTRRTLFNSFYFSVNIQENLFFDPNKFLVVTKAREQLDDQLISLILFSQFISVCLSLIFLSYWRKSKTHEGFLSSNLNLPHMINNSYYSQLVVAFSCYDNSYGERTKRTKDQGNFWFTAFDRHYSQFYFFLAVSFVIIFHYLWRKNKTHERFDHWM